MEMLDCSGNSKALKCLKSVFENVRSANPEGAFAASFRYFEDLLPRAVDVELEEAAAAAADENNGVRERSASKNRCLRLGLVFNARLARCFGHFNKANYFIVEAIHLSQRANDFLCLRLALLENGMLEICTMRYSVLGRFVRNETNFFISEESEAEKGSSSLQFQGADAASATAKANTTASQQQYHQQQQNLQDQDAATSEAEPNKYLSQQIGVCECYMKALNLAIRCESPKSVSELLKRCAAFDMGVDRAAHSKMVREAARAAISTIQVANCSAHPSEIANYVLSDFRLNGGGTSKHDAPMMPPGATVCLSRPVNKEASAILFVNAAYAYALDGRFEKAMQFIVFAKSRFFDEENPMAAHHWQVAEACIQFDSDLFYGRQTDAEILSCFSPTESDFRFALLAANCGEYFKALKILENRLNILQTGMDTVLIIRCFLTLGTTYCEGGAIKSGLKTLQDALSLADGNGQRLLAAMARRRIAYANIINARNVSEAEKLISECATELEKATAPRLERGMYFVTRFKLLAASRRMDEHMESGCEKTALKYLDRARRLFTGHYPQLEKNVYEEAFTFGEAIKDEKICGVCKKLFERKSEHLPEYLNWFLL